MNEPVHGIWKDDSWGSDWTCRYRSIINADSTDKRTEVKYILNEKMYISFSKTCEKQVLEKLFLINWNRKSRRSIWIAG